jgi:hypothetical protein
MLVLMNRALISAIFVLMLSACAGNRYYAVEEAGSGQYYIGETPASIVRYPGVYAPLFAYGLSPWWGYSYYSPYFYPHYYYVTLSPWPHYAPWPYYAPWRHYSYWNAGLPHGYPPYRGFRYHHPGSYPGYHPGDEMAVIPSTGNFGPPSTVPNAERLRMLDDRSLQRELRRTGTPAGQAWNSPTVRRSMAPPAVGAAAPSGSIRSHDPGSRSFGSPSAPGAVRHSSSRSGTPAGAVSRRNPRRHDQ